ncbi:C-type lectin domain family 10 member A-like [Argopecten irradians]|uniref:C-type lectin domain family 10 member A-like n=1 Tax=Argopecten irradians TaxID=31199 RepID=UPI003718218C
MASGNKVLYWISLMSSVAANLNHMEWLEDISRSNQVFSGPVFRITTSSLSLCTAKCTLLPACYGVSLHVDGEDCRGYKRFADSSTVTGTRLWKKVIPCHDGYTYTPSVDMCWKGYTGKDWDDAQQFCLEEDSRLIVFNTQTKLTTIRQALIDTGKGNYYWVGGYKSGGTWLWLDGTPVEMTSVFWGPSEPTGQGYAIYIGWNVNSHGRFDDNGGWDAIPFICEML